MPDHFLNIYNNESANYERLIAREDQHGNLFQTVMEIHPFDGAVIAEFGAGTGLVRLGGVSEDHPHPSPVR